MMSDLPYNTVPLRKIPNVSNAIQSITYVENENLQREYENQKLTFKYQGKVDRSGNVEELLLFHGTTWSCVKEIINNNFDTNAVPQQLTTSNKQRAKSMFFGKGVYLSAIPALSLIYGNALILCKVLPGLSEMLSLPRTQPPPTWRGTRLEGSYARRKDQRHPHDSQSIANTAILCHTTKKSIPDIGIY